MILYEVVIRARLTPEHPKFFEMQFGWMIVAVLAVDKYAAADSARQIAAALPIYEVAGEDVRVTELTRPYPMDLEALELNAERARHNGASLCVIYTEVGTDEDLLKEPFPKTFEPG